MIPRISKREASLRLRIKIVTVFFGLFFAGILFRSYLLQLKYNPKLSDLARKEYEKFVVLSPQRGEIFDRNGLSLASSIMVKSIYANPKIIGNKLSIANKLSKVLSISKESILRKLKSDKHFVWIKRKVTPYIYNSINVLNLEGIGALEESKRYYPNVNLASSVIGFTGLDSKGLSGIELKYEDFLSNTEAKFTQLHDALGRTLFTDGFFVKEFSKGNDVFLTLDRTIQYIAETEFDKELKRVNSTKGYVIVMEPKTGRILAMVSRPNFNPNDFGDSKPDSWLNGAVSLAYEPGSTLKAFVLAAAFEEGLINPKELFYCKKSSLTIAGKTINDTAKKEWLTPSGILKYSSNIGAAKIALLIGKERLYKWMKIFGFGQATGVELPSETYGLLNHYSKWSNLDVATIGFGQGIGVSPLQLISAVSSIANGGYKIKPFIIEKIMSPDGSIIVENNPRTGPRIISEKTSSAIKNYMVGVTEEGGTGEKARIEGFIAAGKTGTSQKIDPATGEYTFEKMVGSFIGFVPSDAPRIAILVVIDEPEGITYGGEIAAPVFRRIAEQSLKYLKVIPEKEISVKLALSGEYPEGYSIREEQNVQSNTLSEEDVLDGAVPNFEGLSIREVLKVAEHLGFSIYIKGSGVAFKQFPEPGSKNGEDKKCTVYFRPI